MTDIADINEIMNIINDASGRLSLLVGQPVEVKIVKPEIPALHPAQKANLHLKSEALKVEITRLVAAQYMVSMSAIQSNSRKRPLPDARKLAAYLLYEYVARITDGQISIMLHIDRTTVIHHRQSCLGLIQTDKELSFNFRQVVKKLDKYINGNN